MLIDFIVDLPNSNGFINIIVVVNRLMKMRYMIFINLINAISVAKYFVKYVFKLHRLSNSIVSDCGS
jgi:UV DNA damage repair endonuclease